MVIYPARFTLFSQRETPGPDTLAQCQTAMIRLTQQIMPRWDGWLDSIVSMKTIRV